MQRQPASKGSGTDRPRDVEGAIDLAPVDTNSAMPTAVERGDVMNEKLLYRIPEVAHYLSLSRSKVYELVRAGVLPSIKIDGVRRIRGVDVLEFVDGLRRVA